MNEPKEQAMQADTRTIPEATTAERLRALCACLRIKPTPLADIIPVLQKAADELDAARSTVRAPVDTLHAAIMNLSERPGDESAYTLSERIAYKKGHKAARHAAAELVAASAQEAAPQQGEILRFLLGEGPLDGVWFGDPHPAEQGAFWWRKHLRAAFAASLQQHDQQEGA